ncbi:MAG: hypothetical protein IKC12_05245 [Alistipes sp.]|nr:hypothetical protein [Alistipes sp.]
MQGFSKIFFGGGGYDGEIREIRELREIREIREFRESTIIIYHYAP